MQNLFDSIRKTQEEETTTATKRALKPHSLSTIKGTNIITPANTMILGGMGSGKTTLITGLIKYFIQHNIYQHYIILHQGFVEETFREYMKSSSNSLVYVHFDDSLEFLNEYIRIKMQFFSILTYMNMSKKDMKQQLNDPVLNEIYERARAISRRSGGKLSLEEAFNSEIANVMDTFTSPFSIKIAENSYSFSPLSRKCKSIILFDDIGQFSQLLGNKSKNNSWFLGQLQSVRHYLIDVYFSGQSHVQTHKDVRRSITNWWLGYNIPQDDIKTIGEFISTPSDTSMEDLTFSYNSLQQFDFLFTNPQSFEIIRSSNSSKKNKEKDEDKQQRVSSSKEKLEEVKKRLKELEEMESDNSEKEEELKKNKKRTPVKIIPVKRKPRKIKVTVED